MFEQAGITYNHRKHKFVHYQEAVPRNTPCVWCAKPVKHGRTKYGQVLQCVGCSCIAHEVCLYDISWRCGADRPDRSLSKIKRRFKDRLASPNQYILGAAQEEVRLSIAGSDTTSRGAEDSGAAEPQGELDSSGGASSTFVVVSKPEPQARARAPTPASRPKAPAARLTFSELPPPSPPSVVPIAAGVQEESGDSAEAGGEDDQGARSPRGAMHPSEDVGPEASSVCENTSGESTGGESVGDSHEGDGGDVEEAERRRIKEEGSQEGAGDAQEVGTEEGHAYTNEQEHHPNPLDKAWTTTQLRQRSRQISQRDFTAVRGLIGRRSESGEVMRKATSAVTIRAATQVEDSVMKDCALRSRLQLLLDYSERMRKEMERERTKHDASLAALEAGLAQAAESLSKCRAAQDKQYEAVAGLLSACDDTRERTDALHKQIQEKYGTTRHSKYNGLHPSKPRFFVDSAASTAVDGGTVPGNEAPGKEEGTAEPMDSFQEAHDGVKGSATLLQRTHEVFEELEAKIKLLDRHHHSVSDRAEQATSNLREFGEVVKEAQELEGNDDKKSELVGEDLVLSPSGTDLLSRAEAIFPPTAEEELSLTRDEKALGRNNSIVFSNVDTSSCMAKGTRMVKAASVDKLVEMLSFHKYPDLRFQHTFLLTYHAFMTPFELMEKLIMRYCIAPPSISGSTPKLKTSVQIPVRLRVLNVFKLWIEGHYERDFRDERMAQLMEDFLDNTVSMTGNGVFAKKLKRLITNKRENIEQSLMYCLPEGLPEPILPPEHVLKGPLSVLSIDPLELARQLTLYEHRSYKAIQTSEFLNQKWSRPDRESAAPNICNVTSQFNQVGMWVVREVLSARDLETRVNTVKAFIKIALELFRINNFNATLEMVAGLENTAVHRLKKTWEGVGQKHDAVKHTLRLLMKTNFAAYREALLHATPPCLPYIGVFLTDLTFLEDGNPDRVQGLVNFDKLRRVTDTISAVQQYQNDVYAFKEVPQLQEYLANMPDPMDDQEAYERSIEIEPREVTATAKADWKHVELRKAEQAGAAAMYAELCKVLDTVW